MNTHLSHSIIALALFLAPFGSAHAVPNNTAAFNIDRVYVQGAFRLTPAGTAVENPEGCSLPDSYEVLSSHPLTRELLATALTAYATGQPVFLQINGCTSSGRPSVALLVAL